MWSTGENKANSISIFLHHKIKWSRQDFLNILVKNKDCSRKHCQDTAPRALQIASTSKYKALIRN